MRSSASQPATPDRSNALPRRLVYVVHGIGDQARGDPVQELAEGLAQHDGCVLADDARQLHIAERRSERAYESVPVRVHHVVNERRDDTLVEVPWADLSRLRRTGLGLMVGAFRGLFGMRVVADEACKSLEDSGRFQALTNFVHACIAGPIASCNLTLALLGTLLVTRFFPEAIAMLGVSEVDSVAVATALLLWFVPGRLIRIPVFVRSNRAFAVLLVSRPLWRHWWRIAPTASEVGEMGAELTVVLNLSWFFALAGVGALAVTWWLRPDRTSKPARAVVTVTVLALVLWLFLLPTAWAGLFKVFGGSLPEHLRVDAEALAQKTHIGLLLIWLFGGAIIAVAWSVHRRRRRVGRERERRGTLTEQDVDAMPRLIVAEPVERVLLVTAVAMGIIGAPLSLGLINTGVRLSSGTLQETWLDLHGLAGAPGKFVALLAAATALSLWFFRQRLHGPLDLALDVLSYLDTERVEQEGETLVARERIQRRVASTIRQTWEHYRREGREFDEVVFVSHSQGTVLLIADLFGPAQQRQFGATPVRLVTAGSPYSHIYQAYFPSTFRFDLSGMVDRWDNFCRIDDPIGTVIDPGTYPAEAFRQHVVGRGGHSGYWSDPRVLARLCAPEGALRASAASNAGPSAGST